MSKFAYLTSMRETATGVSPMKINYDVKSKYIKLVAEPKPFVPVYMNTEE